VACFFALAKSPANCDDKTDEIIDAHTHFYDPARPEGVPWPGKTDKLLYRTVLPRDFLAVARPVGVTRTIVVEASPWLEDNQWLLDLAAKDRTIVGVVGRLFPGDDKFADHLKRFAKNPLFRGIRINKDELEKGLVKSGYVTDLKRLGEHGLTLDVNGGPDMPAVVARLAAQVPSLRIVINHAGNLPIDGKAPPESWLKGMKQAAAGKNVYCKVSALVEGAVPRNQKAPAGVAYYRPVLDALWDTFGPDRLIYGSNWPVSDSRADYATVFGIVRQYFSEKGDVAARKFFTDNARKAWAR
jgi:predicted TIM-barrel fold metal-dependent hydrolase